MTHRKMAPKYLMLCLAALLLSAATGALAAGQVGEMAEDFALNDLSGTEHTMSQYQGFVRYLVFMGYG